MISYLVKILVLIMFSILVMVFYYSNGTHVENFDGYFPYIMFIAVIYGIYKMISVGGLVVKEKLSITPLKIGGYFLAQLLLLSILFFHYTGDLVGIAIGNGITLFFQIFFYTLLPICIIIISLSFGKKILGNILDGYQKESANYRFITGIGFGFFSFVFLLTIIGMLGFYNLISVSIILCSFIIISYKEFIITIKGIFTYKIIYKNHQAYSKDFLEQLSPKLLSMEFLFIVISLLLAINLISIFRPFPIGWDDLGAYMNDPRLMADAGFIGELGSMMSWQTFTGIGYMFNNPTLAFFLNNAGGFLSVIVIILIISEIFKTKKETFIHLPLLAATLFVSMPMIVFQQAKDMKLDPGLFFISIIALYMLFHFYTKPTEKKDHTQSISKKEILKLFGIIGILLGFAFTIKFTSLLLISAIFGILFYARLGMLGFFGYLSIYFAIFTAGGLWKMLNVVALDSSELKINLSLISLIIGIALLITARVKTKKRFRKFIPRILSMSLGIVIAILPWGIINISSIGGPGDHIGVSKIINGNAKKFNADYSKIYLQEELNTLEKNSIKIELSRSGTTTNEDFGRYFGYEKGINNYVKLPWNLTMQNNQGGEFTTIGFLFLAFLPTIFLFLPFKRKEYTLGIYGLIFFEVLLFVIPQSRDYFTQIMAQLSLPYGYIFILLLALIPLVFFIPTLGNKALMKLFKLNLVFAIFYSFLWGVSAFGIVWYGIVMYFNFILMIIFGVYYMGAYDSQDTKKNIQLRFFGTLVFSIIFLIYIFMSIFPHSMNNLKGAAYKDYKVGNLTLSEAPFHYHREYLPILFHLNTDLSKQELFFKNSIVSDKLHSIIKKNNITNNIVGIQAMLYKISQDMRLDFSLRNNAKISLNNIYNNITKPEVGYQNHSGIFRIGTFLKYHIIENNKRLLEDSLLIAFDKYIYHSDLNITIERIKKIGITYLLVDLNAATIDKDPRHALTTKYEKLLTLFTSDKLELIETDSLCLKVGLDQYKIDKNIDSYIELAGVNHDSYPSGKGAIGRTTKQKVCYRLIISLIDQGKVTPNTYPYLQPYISHLSQLSSLDQKILFLHKYAGHGFKVLFKLK